MEREGEREGALVERLPVNESEGAQAKKRYFLFVSQRLYSTPLTTTHCQTTVQRFVAMPDPASVRP